MASGHQATVDIDEPYMTGYVKALSADPLFNEPQDLFHMIKSQLSLITLGYSSRLHEG